MERVAVDGNGLVVQSVLPGILLAQLEVILQTPQQAHEEGREGG